MVDYEQYVTERRLALCRLAGVLSGNPVLADDLVADVLTTAYEKWDRVSRADNVHAYVRRMVVNRYLQSQRRAARTVLLADLEPHASPEPDPADQHADRTTLAQELLALPSQQRAVLVLRYYEGLRTDEIAELLGTRETTVRSNAARALRRLRIRLDDPEDGSGHSRAATTMRSVGS